jgi:2-polyprenyl-6-methoxyphenol hydroxylase-like FAD-dependent oxidoreductase
VGLKGQAEDVSLTADLEMHFLPDGYVGICRLPGGKVNVCGLFRRPLGAASTAAGVLEPLRGPEGGPLWRKLEKAKWNGSSACAVAGLGIGRQSIADKDECCVGDAQGLIPPVTGNGMSLALESAELAVDSVAAYARGECDWNTVVKTVATRCNHAFHRRLTWSRWMHRALFVPALRAGLAGVILQVGPAWRWAFSVTR